MALHAAFRTNLYRVLLNNVRPKVSILAWSKVRDALKHNHDYHDGRFEYRPDQNNVNMAMTWIDTPQGDTFWRCVHLIHYDGVPDRLKGQLQEVILGKRAHLGGGFDDGFVDEFDGNDLHPAPILVEPAPARRLPRAPAVKEEAPLIVF